MSEEKVDMCKHCGERTADSVEEPDMCQRCDDAATLSGIAIVLGETIPEVMEYPDAVAVIEEAIDKLNTMSIRMM